MTQVFGCPCCNNPFQVPADAAGQTFECPTCNANIEIPADANRKVESKVGLNEKDDDLDVFDCPHCSGRFSIDLSTATATVSCPHCDREVEIEDPEADSEVPIFEPEPAKKKPKWKTETETSPPSEKSRATNKLRNENDAKQEKQEKPTEFQPLPVDDLLPPRFDVPDPVRFPPRRGSDEVILPDGDGGYQSVEANVVTMVHDGQVYRLKRLTPQQRHRRKMIHSGITIVVAIVLIYLTMRTIGLFS